MPQGIDSEGNTYYWESAATRYTLEQRRNLIFNAVVEYDFETDEPATLEQIDELVPFGRTIIKKTAEAYGGIEGLEITQTENRFALTVTEDARSIHLVCERNVEIDRYNGEDYSTSPEQSHPSEEPSSEWSYERADQVNEFASKLYGVGYGVFDREANKKTGERIRQSAEKGNF